MLTILRRRLPVQIDGQQAYAFQKQVDASLSPLISGVRREYFKRLGVEAEEVEKWMQREQQLASSPLLAGDVLLRDQETVLYYRVPRGEGYIEAGVITRGDAADHQEFFDTVRGAARSALGTETPWEAAGVDGDVADTIAGEATVVVPTQQEVQAAREMESEASQKLVGQILTTGSIFFNKLTQAVTGERGAIEKTIDRFEQLKVVSKDFAVLCRKTGQQILRVSSRDAIEDPSQKTFKCFICGNSVSEESIDEIITVTDFGRKLLDKDYWLVVRVLGALESAGIPNQQVRIHTGESGLTNFFVTLNDQLYLIVVTNRKLTLEESYLINAHVAAYAVAHCIVISTARVSRLMRHHLEKTSPSAEFDFLDSLNSLEDRFLTIMRHKEKAVLRNVLANFSALTPVHVQDLVMQRISPESDFFEKAAQPRPAPTPHPAAAVAAPHPPPTSEPEAGEGDFSMMGEVLESDESMMTEETQVGQ
jgi:hypothetical protein